LSNSIPRRRIHAELFLDLRKEGVEISTQCVHIDGDYCGLPHFKSSKVESTVDVEEIYGCWLQVVFVIFPQQDGHHFTYPLDHDRIRTIQMSETVSQRLVEKTPYGLGQVPATREMVSEEFFGRSAAIE